MDSLNSVDRPEPSTPAEAADLLLPPRHPARSVSGKKAHVLLVDDDQEIARAVKLRLRKSGYAVTVAFNGEAGLQAALESPPDAIILDMRMPLMDGLTMLTEMRREERMRGIPVILLSAFMREDDKRAALRLGASYFIEKPYDSLVLVEAVEQAVGR
jgi:DNA-binding response OmpR family regulator